MNGWNLDTVGSVGPNAVTIVEGSSFFISAANGDLDLELAHGVFYQDTRIVSRWNLLVNNHVVEGLMAVNPEPYRAVFTGRAPQPDGAADRPMVIERDRQVGDGIRETLTLRNYSTSPAPCTIKLAVEADFADLFEVKAGRKTRQLRPSHRPEGDRLIISGRHNGRLLGVTVRAPGADVNRHGVMFKVTVPAKSSWTATIVVTPSSDGNEPAGKFSASTAQHESVPALRHRIWVAAAPQFSMDNSALERTLRQSQQDLGSLRIQDPAHPDRTVIAAGAPWFMALFGRDSLLTSLMALPVDPTIALGTLQTLAEHQGQTINKLTEEQPGRILHEVRLGSGAALSLGGGNTYYGTADATPLFVKLLGEVSSWGLEPRAVQELLPNADRALDWITGYGDPDGDGFVEYERASRHGLLNQGWKDSYDGISFADGTLAEPPIAVCEVQGYVYSAYLARALLALDSGDSSLARHWGDRAAVLKEAFNRRFWMPQRGYFAVALDKDKIPVDACASNMGHCLWSGIVDDDKAPLVAQRLMEPDMFSGWGVRTLASTMGAYNPVSYHNGSVWPHDNALIAAGLMRYGFIEESQRVAMAIFDAAEAFGGRLPELFCGFPREPDRAPVAYPSSCSPQAWASATPIHLLRILLRFDPSAPTGRLWLSPAFPDGFGYLKKDQVPLAGSRLTIEVSGNAAHVTGLPPSIELHLGTQDPRADLIRVHQDPGRKAG
ncbi:glycogen debranching N-terminal domain-containing protein [Arthrobacter sp. ISL-72]|uniref:amylo-alpha-1,6-glucosidase n=1 Tax=Arthrobacter sp. ISL-72 TaxID=2819114 RepID=UPI001BEB3D99|nr:glycogen debranching N-terminal domain-containing protein [Arthrobacter sp. ISL-72]MBT2597638.1 amylo-alpha-1,6-glucosidase [Arthrobacter sp. ISL-72]